MTMDSILICELCGNTFSFPSSLRRHYRTKHQGYSFGKISQTASRLGCRLCENTFSTRYGLKRHYEVEHYEYSFNEIFESSRPRPTSLKDSMASRRICELCNSTFCNTFGLKRHYRNKHHGHSFIEHSNSQKSNNVISRRTCDLCNSTFSNTFGLKRHYRNKHGHSYSESSRSSTSLKSNVASRHTCELCKSTFSKTFGLKRHYTSKHCGHSFSEFSRSSMPLKTNVASSRPTCELCNSTFSKIFALKRHYRNKHHGHIFSVASRSSSLKRSVASRHTCELCNSTLSTMFALRRHYKRKHHMYSFKEASRPKSITLKCSICSSIFGKSIELNNHLINQHEIVLDTVNVSFQNLNEFERWKKSIEEEQQSFFVKNKGITRPVNDRVTSVAYFQCNRSGYYRGISCSSTERKRRIKIQGSSKINAYCPARIRANCKSDGTIDVTFCKTHVGHGVDLAHIPLPNDVKKQIASKIAQQISFDTILDCVQGSVNGEIKREHILSKQDLRNIIKEYSLDSEYIRNTEEFSSIEAWVDQVSASDKSCILLYKPNGVESPDYPELKSEDFMLGIMTDAQLEMLKKYGHDCICIDSTHPTDACKIGMTTLLVANNMHQGFPCAFYFSNRNDRIGIDIFLLSIRDSVGVVNTKVLMTDMSDIFYNAWKCIMGDVGKRLFCTWQIQRAWQKNLNQVKSHLKIKETSKKIFTLLYEVDEKAFEIILPIFIEELGADSDTAGFGKYFQDNYQSNCKSWAYCYRKNAAINTNTYLERLHNIFKHFYLKGKMGKRLDITVQALMRFIDHKQFDNSIALCKGMVTSKVRNIRDRHKRSLCLTIDNLLQLGNDTWGVFSISSVGLLNVYTVTLNKTSCDCLLICEHCKACIHMFNCTCIDACIQENMCKHIHLVCQAQTFHLTKEDTNESQIESEKDGENDLDTYQLVLNEAENCYEVCVILSKGVSEDGNVLIEPDLDSRKQEASDIISLMMRKIQSVKQLEIMTKALKSAEPEINAIKEEDRYSKTLPQPLDSPNVYQV